MDEVSYVGSIEEVNANSRLELHKGEKGRKKVELTRWTSERHSSFRTL